MPRERPIIFSGPMVRAILDGRKTQTRRVVKPQPATPTWHTVELEQGFIRDRGRNMRPIKSPFTVSQQLWVRETFVLETSYEPPKDDMLCLILGRSDDPFYSSPHYRATEPEPHIVPDDLEDEYDDRTRWSPSIFMPRWASRITLEVTGVRVERVQEITVEDVWAEGIEHDTEGYAIYNGQPGYAPRHAFWELWDSLNTKRGYGWDANPWVWVVEFKLLEVANA